MIGSSKNNRENYPKIIHFWAKEKGTRVKFNPGLSANCPLNNWVLNVHLALTVGYLNPVLNNSAQVYLRVSLPSIMTPCSNGLARGELEGSRNPSSFFLCHGTSYNFKRNESFAVKENEKKINWKSIGQFYPRQWNFEFFKIKFCAMKVIPTESWDNGVFEITEILCILSMCLMWEGMKSGEFESHCIWNFWKEILNKVFTSKKTWQ